MEIEAIFSRLLQSKGLDDRFFTFEGTDLILNVWDYDFEEVEGYIICPEEHFCISKRELKELQKEFKFQLQEV